MCSSSCPFFSPSWACSSPGKFAYPADVLYTRELLAIWKPKIQTVFFGVLSGRRSRLEREIHPSICWFWGSEGFPEGAHRGDFFLKMDWNKPVLLTIFRRKERTRSHPVYKNWYVVWAAQYNLTFSVMLIWLFFFFLVFIFLFCNFVCLFLSKKKKKV